MAHRPIAIDGAGADGSTVGPRGVEPGSSNDHGGDGVCIDQVVIPTTPPCPGARDKYVVRNRLVNERGFPSPSYPSTGCGSTLRSTRRRG